MKRERKRKEKRGAGHCVRGTYIWQLGRSCRIGGGGGGALLVRRRCSSCCCQAHHILAELLDVGQTGRLAFAPGLQLGQQLLLLVAQLLDLDPDGRLDVFAQFLAPRLKEEIEFPMKIPLHGTREMREGHRT